MGTKKSEIDVCIEKIAACSALLRESDIRQIYAEKGKEEAVNFIISRNNPFVVRLAYAWKYNADKYGVEFQDLISAGRLALIMATRNYNPAKGSYFRYVSRYISSYVQSEFYKLCDIPRLEGKRRHKNHERLNAFESLSREIADNGEDEPLTLEDLLSHPDDKKVLPALELNDLLERLKKANGKIHPLASDIIEMRFGIGASNEPLSLQKVAQSLNMSKEGIRKVEGKALAYLSSL